MREVEVSMELWQSKLDVGINNIRTECFFKLKNCVTKIKDSFIYHFHQKTVNSLIHQKINDSLKN